MKSALQNQIVPANDRHSATVRPTTLLQRNRSNELNNAYEPEASSIAEAVANDHFGMRATRNSFALVPTARVPGESQRGGAPAHNKPTVMPGSAGSGGQSLPKQIRSSLEKQFQAPLASVRIHDNPTASSLTRKQHANAMTIGEDIHFAKGRYRPFETRGQQLLAHELTHVLQQRQSGSRNSVSASEAEARAFAERSVNGGALPMVRHSIRASQSAPLLDPSRAREVLEDELDDIICNVKNAWPHIRTATQNERDDIRNDPVLERNIRRRSSEMELLQTYLLLTYQTEDLFPAHYKAFVEATDILGTHEARIHSILRGVSPVERAEMQNMPGLVEVIEDEMSGSDRQTALQLLYGAVQQQGAAITSEHTSTHMEVGERYMLDIDTAGSFDTIRDNVQEAAKADGSDTILDDTSLWAKFVDRFNKEETWYLRMIARYKGPENFPLLTGPSAPTQSFIYPIWDSVKIVGTDEDKLIETLNEVNRATGITGGGGRALQSPPKEELKVDPWFVPMLEDELSGSDLNRAMNAISASASVTVGIRDDLRKAINKRNMTRIRQLLTDLELTQSDRQTLATDAEILDEMGEDLNGPQLCETSLLLKYGFTSFPADVTALLEKFQQSPIDVSAVVTLLQSLNSAGGLGALRSEPGIYFMITNSGLATEDVAKILAAIRADQPGYQEPGSEGTHRHHAERVQARLPVNFAGTEVRIPIRCNVDLSKMKGKKEMDSGKLEDWVRAIDEVWNNKFVLVNDGRTYSLVFNAYMAVGVSAPDVTIYILDWSGRSYVHPVYDPAANVWIDREMFLYVEDLDAGVIAHEFGHILGNPDEYALTASEYSRITGSPARPRSLRGGETVKGEMGRHSESSAVEIRHAAPALEVINAARDTTAFPNPFVLQRR